MKLEELVKTLQAMGYLSPLDNDALKEFHEAVMVCDLGQFIDLTPDGDVLPQHAQRIYEELGGTETFSLVSKSVGTGSEPVPNQSPRRIEGGTEPGEPGTIAPLLFDESMLPAKALDEIEEIGRAMERAYDMALDSRLSRINAGDRALAAIERRWGNAPKGGV